MKKKSQISKMKRANDLLFELSFLKASDDINHKYSTPIPRNMTRISIPKKNKRRMKANSIDSISYEFFWTSKAKSLLFLHLKNLKYNFSLIMSEIEELSLSDTTLSDYQISIFEKTRTIWESLKEIDTFTVFEKIKEGTKRLEDIENIILSIISISLVETKTPKNLSNIKFPESRLKINISSLNEVKNKAERFCGKLVLLMQYSFSSILTFLNTIENIKFLDDPMIAESNSDSYEFLDLGTLRNCIKNPLKFIFAVEILFTEMGDQIREEQISGIKKDFHENMQSIKKLFDDYLNVKEEQEKIEIQNLEITCRICNQKFKVEALKEHSTLCLERINLLREFHTTNEILQKFFEEIKQKKSELIRESSKISRMEKKRDWSSDLSDENTRNESRRDSTMSISTFDSPRLQKSLFAQLKGKKPSVYASGNEKTVGKVSKPKVSNSEDLLPLAECLTEEKSDNDSDEKKVNTDPSMTSSQIKGSKPTPPLRRSSKKDEGSKLGLKKTGDLKSKNTLSTVSIKKPLPNIEFKDREIKRSIYILEEILKYGEKLSHEQGDYNLSSTITIIPAESDSRREIESLLSEENFPDINRFLERILETIEVSFL